MSGEMMEEQELIGRVRDGDPGAIDDIVETYKGPLFAFILRMVNDHETAEDLFQETWLRVVRYIHSFRGESKFSTWLFQIAMNLCRDTVRKKRRWTQEPIEDHVYHLSDDPDVDPVRMLRAQQVRTIINELPMKMREVIVLKYYHDLSDKEIADIVRCPEGTIKSRYYRGSEIIRKKWEHLNKGI